MNKNRYQILLADTEDSDSVTVVRCDTVTGNVVARHITTTGSKIGVNQLVEVFDGVVNKSARD